MKNLFIIVLGLSAVVCLNTLRANPQTKPPTAPASKPATITGMISLDEKSFIAESDLKIWTVANPNVLKGHAGHRVSITANVDGERQGHGKVNPSPDAPAARKQ
jgi:hypothetical protein